MEENRRYLLLRHADDLGFLNNRIPRIAELPEVFEQSVFHSTRKLDYEVKISGIFGDVAIKGSM